MTLLRLIFKTLAYFESHATYQALSFGICVGMLLGLSPFYSLQFWLFLPLIFLIKLNLATTLFSWGFFALIGYLGTPMFSAIGQNFLTAESLLQFWSFLFEAPFIPFTDFYKPETLGKLILSVALVVPLFIMSMKLCKALDAFVYHWWRTTKLYTLYRTYKPYAR